MQIAKMITISACALALAACSGSDPEVDGGGGDAGLADNGGGGDTGVVDTGGGDTGVTDTGGNNPNPPALGALIDRGGRPAINTALIAPIADEPAKGARKDAYNEAARAGWADFTPDIIGSLAVFDSLDTVCGNQFGADTVTGSSNTPARYGLLGGALTDDRLYVNGESTTCTQYLAVEVTAATGGAIDLSADCGGRAPAYDVIATTYSALAIGAFAGVDDGIAADDVAASDTFPFLADPL